MPDTATATALPTAEDLGGYRHPSAYTLANFISFPGLTPEAEFDLIAPVAIYFLADLLYKEKARKALTQLKRLHHPLFSDNSVNTTLEMTSTPAGLTERYNALLAQLVLQEAPSAEAYVDEWGAFSFRVPGDTTLLSGDSSGVFAFYLKADLLKQRVQFAM